MFIAGTQAAREEIAHRLRAGQRPLDLVALGLAPVGHGVAQTPYQMCAIFALRTLRRCRAQPKKASGSQSPPSPKS